MPSRWLCVAIVAFWLAANAWLCWRDVVPIFVTGRPPPFTIDFIDEVEMNHPADTAWKVLRDGQEIYRAITKVTPRKEDDAFELSCLVTVNAAVTPGGKVPEKGIFSLNRFESSYRVARDGGLQEMTQQADGLIKVGKADNPVTYALGGRVQDEQLLLTHKTQMKAPWLGHAIDREDALGRLSLSSRASVLAPLHPMNRMPHLSLAQSWSQVFVDLVSGTNLTTAQAFRRLQAHVRPEPEVLSWRNREASCLVVVCEDNDCEVLTWVERDGGLVLKQQVTYAKDSAHPETWTLERER
jgi:hypothetical protein